MAVLTTAKFKEWASFSGTTHDTLIADCISIATDICQRYLQRNIEETTETETIFISSTTPILKVSKYPITSLTAITHNGDSVDVTNITIRTTKIGLSYTDNTHFSVGKYIVVYKYGYASAVIPDELKHIVFRIATRIFQNGYPGNMLVIPKLEDEDKEALNGYRY